MRYKFVQNVGWWTKCSCRGGGGVVSQNASQRDYISSSSFLQQVSRLITGKEAMHDACIVKLQGILGYCPPSGHGHFLAPYPPPPPPPHQAWALSGTVNPRHEHFLVQFLVSHKHPPAPGPLLPEHGHFLTQYPPPPPVNRRTETLKTLPSHHISYVRGANQSTFV